MSKIILQPSGNKDGREHYVDTIETPVPLVRVQPYVKPAEFDVLNQIYPSGQCQIWGVTPAGANFTKWNKINIGDVTLFSRDGHIYASAVTTFKLHSRNLAAELWQYNNKRETWEYIYFLDEIKSLHIPYLQFNRTVGYADNYVIQGFNVLTNEQSKLITHAFDLDSDVYVPQIDDHQYAALLAQITGLEATEQEIITKRRLEQGYLANHIFGRNVIGTCACCHQEYPVSLLVTAHIKKRSFCTPEEKRDLNVVMPMCKFGCDELFERGYIAVQNGQFIKLGKTLTSQALENHINQVTGNQCSYFTENTRKYFDWHFQHHR